jgi:hypothetical protein
VEKYGDFLALHYIKTSVLIPGCLIFPLTKVKTPSQNLHPFPHVSSTEVMHEASALFFG